MREKRIAELGTVKETKNASQDSEKTTKKPALRKKRLRIKTFIGEFDPGSGRTLAACLTHASRTVQHLTLNALKARIDQNSAREMRTQRASRNQKRATTKRREH